MTGVDKMISQILEEADAAASQKEADAASRAEAILSEAEKEAEILKTEIEEKSEKELAGYESRHRLADEQKRRTALLLAKQEIISDTIEKAYQKFCSMETEAYFEVIAKMIRKFALPKEGEILFSEKDLGRMPEGFRAEIARAAKEKGGSLTVSGETRRMEGGFVLVYGGVEENCSFRALFDSRKDELQDKVNRLLFF